MTINERRNPYTVHPTPPTVTSTSSLLPVSRNLPFIVIRVPPALGPLLGSTVSGIGFWWRGHKIQHECIHLFSTARIHKPTQVSTHATTHTRTHLTTQRCRTHSQALSPPLISLTIKNIHTHAQTHSYKHHICLNLLSKQLGGALPCGGALTEPEIWKAC